MVIPQNKLFEVLRKVEKPARYLGGEVNSIAKSLESVDFKVALVMPETYEIGQSNLGLKILYEAANRIPGVAAERVYAPWIDAEKVFREEKLPVFSLENKIPLNEFDLIGISLPYELSYTNILTLFDLCGIPFRASDRTGLFPIILGGGNQAFNPEPIADFFDAFVVGDGEEALVGIIEKIREYKKSGGLREKKSVILSETKNPPSTPGGSFAIAQDDMPLKISLLRDISKIQGVYIPSFFDVSYNENGTLSAITPKFPDYSGVKKSTVKDLDQAVFPTAPVVPSVRTVHDRLCVEVQRGCVRGCRFCQAGYIYRPERQRSPERILNIVEESLPKTGDDQISLLSLSVGDYGCLVPLVRELFDRYEKKKVSVSLPATRTDTFSPEVIQEVKRVRMTGFTIAPEAGTPRMRRVINKGNSREDLYRTVENIFKEGWQLIKFYYMCGLPFEHFEDLEGIVDEGHGALAIGRKYTKKARINLSVSPHVPKPHTPFQWEAQDSIEVTQKKIAHIKSKLRDRGVELKYHDPYDSYMEGIFARGDRRLSRVIEKAWKMGCRFDGWQETFNFERWMGAFRECGIDPNFYVSRRRNREEVLPWDHLFVDLEKQFLWNEKEAAFQESFIPDCSVDKCTYCGICDFHEVKNINYRVSPSPQPSPVRGEGDEDSSNSSLLGEPVTSNLPCPSTGEGQEEDGPNVKSVIKFSTRGRRLEQKDFDFSKLSASRTSGEEKDLNERREKVLTNYRCRFTKMGEVAFLSHLEVMGVLKRALSRAEVRMKFSEGYHPQPRLSLGQALPVGVESLSEFFDLEVEGDLDPPEFLARVNQALPKGLQVESCEKILPRTPSVASSIVGAVWKVELPRSYPGGRGRLEDRLRWLGEQTELTVTRKREDGDRKVNIRPFIASAEAQSDRSITLVTRFLPSGSTRPQEVLQCLLEDPETMLSGARFTKVESLLS